MRFLHTSDWHLGRSFHGVDLLDVQREALAEITAWVAQYGVDVVVVAGDVYDRAQPRTEVVELLSDTLAQLRESGAYVVITSGNHDSAGRLGFGARIMAHGGVFFRTALDHAAAPVVFTVGEGHVRAHAVDPTGANRGPEHGVAFYGIPYLEPRAVAESLGTHAQHEAVLAAVLERIAEDAAQHPERATLVAAHAFVTGGAASDSESLIDSGGLGTVAAERFAGHDYVALGHLHRPQRVSDTVRYSGSPVSYSFSEAGQRKLAWLVELGPTASGSPLAEHTELSWQPLPAGGRVAALEHRVDVPMARLRGTLDSLLEDPDHEPARQAWCQVVLTDPQRPAAAMDRIRTRFPRTIELRWEPEDASRPKATRYATRVGSATSPEQLCDRFFDHVRDRPVDEAESRVLRDVLATVGARQHAQEQSR